MTKAALKSKHDIEGFAASQEFYHNNGWTDGLPVGPRGASSAELARPPAPMGKKVALGGGK